MQGTLVPLTYGDTPTGSPGEARLPNAFAAGHRSYRCSGVPGLNFIVKVWLCAARTTISEA